jgi:Divergent InlB B-repeat domain
MAARTSATRSPRVTLSATVSEGGTLVGGPIDCPGVCTATVDVGTRITLDATSDAFHDRGRFGGACEGSAFTCTLTMTKNETVTVDFPLGVRELTLTGGDDDTFVEFNNGDTCPGHALCIRRNVPKGSTVVLTAHDGPNFVFDHWEGSCTGSANPCRLTMNVNHSVTSRYRPR